MKTTLTVLGLLASSGISLMAADQDAAELKLREGLRNAMLQARTLQAERDALQAEKTQMEQEKKAATEQAEALQKQMASDKEAADKSIADLKDKVANQSGQIVELKDNLDKWKASHAEMTGVAKKKEAERATLAQEKIELQRVVADQQRKNLEMYRIGMEVLGRYEKFGLGTALTAREPFTGLMRVKLENLVQDYGDKLSDQRIKPSPSADQAAARDAESARKSAAASNEKKKKR